ncbi:MAG: ATP-binding protein [Candidatus Moraniibacteriota bacterium]
MVETFKKLKKYNIWAGERLDTGFARKMYTKKILAFSGDKLVKVILGQRRVGKSFIMRQVMRALIDSGTNPKNIFYLNKELVDFDEVKNYKDLGNLIDVYKKELKIRGKIFIFLDEVQEIEGWEKIVNSLSQDHKQVYEVFISGSNSKMLSSELATYLSGRYVDFLIFPFVYAEYIEFKKIKRGKESFLAYLKDGGLPELFNLPSEEMKEHYLSALKNTILLKDIIQRYKIKDSQLLESLFKFLANNIGNLFSVNSIVNFLTSQKIKTNHETISNYLGYILEAYIFHEVERFDIKGKNILASSRKYYLNDLSFRNFLSSSFDFGLGKHLENAIYIYFRTQGYRIFVGSFGKKEVDFIVEKGQVKKYVQVAYSLSDEKVAMREFGNLAEIHDAYEKIVISMDDISLGSKEGIRHICAWEL